MSRLAITTAIPYVNAKPHIGFALELVQADVLARAHRNAGDDVVFLTGTDENSIKNVQAAEKAGVPVQQFVYENAEVFKELAKALNISHDDFIRTTEPRHLAGAKKLWEACAKDIFKKSYEGLYCTGCETFYLEKDLENGLCPEHKTKPDAVQEENYFFKLSAYQESLEKAFAEHRIRIHPAGRQNEVLNFIKQGLEDFSISRSNERAKNWGVDVPGDTTQKMYVWFDALANYITALGYGSGDEAAFGDFWSNGSILHVIGKGITKFHAIYWPAMLMSAGVFPKNGLDIFVHGYVTANGEKISKSLGNAVDPFALVEKYGADAVRYFLLREIPATEDGDYSEEKFVQRYNSDLANGLGNLVQRVSTLAEKYGLRNLSQSESHAAPYGEQETAMAREFGKYEFHRALAALWLLVANGNQYVDEQKPWQKSGVELERVLANLVRLLLHIAILLRPYLPKTSGEIFKRFGAPADLQEIAASLAVEIKTGEPLFKRV